MKPDKIKGKYKIPKPQINNTLNKKKKFPIENEVIQSMRNRASEKIIFSFRFFDREHELFNMGSMEKRSIPICSEWFITLLDTLKSVSNITVNELKSQRQHYDYHEHDWNNLKTKYNFDDDFLEQVECVQFRLSASSGRVHGFVIGNTFYIVWLDPHHNLYPDERFGGTKYYLKPETCFEKIIQENVKLKKENYELMQLLEIKTS